MEFFNQTWTFWVALMSGVVGLILSVIQRFRGKDVSNKVFIRVSVGCLFLAMYIAWSNENTAKVELEKVLVVERDKSTPKLEAQIYRASTLIQGAKTPVLFVWVAINNAGAPSVVWDWSLWITQHNGTRLGPFLADAYLEDLTYEFNDGSAPFTFSAEDSLINKTSDPIPTGGRVPGILLFDTRLPKPSILNSASAISLTFKDITKRRHETETAPVDLAKAKAAGEITLPKLKSGRSKPKE